MRLEHVASRAGVGKATIYRRWASKEALAQELLSAHQLSEVRAGARAEVDEATRLAEESPNPPRASLDEHVYAEAVPESRENQRNGERGAEE